MGIVPINGLGLQSLPPAKAKKYSVEKRKIVNLNSILTFYWYCVWKGSLQYIGTNPASFWAGTAFDWATSRNDTIDWVTENTINDYFIGLANRLLNPQMKKKAAFPYAEKVYDGEVDKIPRRCFDEYVLNQFIENPVMKQGIGASQENPYYVINPDILNAFVLPLDYNAFVNALAASSKYNFKNGIWVWRNNDAQVEFWKWPLDYHTTFEGLIPYYDAAASMPTMGISIKPFIPVEDRIVYPPELPVIPPYEQEETIPDKPKEGTKDMNQSTPTLYRPNESWHQLEQITKDIDAAQLHTLETKSLLDKIFEFIITLFK